MIIGLQRRKAGKRLCLCSGTKLSCNCCPFLLQGFFDSPSDSDYHPGGGKRRGKGGGRKLTQRRKLVKGNDELV